MACSSQHARGYTTLAALRDIVVWFIEPSLLVVVIHTMVVGVRNGQRLSVAAPAAAAGRYCTASLSHTTISKVRGERTPCEGCGSGARRLAQTERSAGIGAQATARPNLTPNECPQRLTFAIPRSPSGRHSDPASSPRRVQRPVSIAVLTRNLIGSSKRRLFAQRASSSGGRCHTSRGGAGGSRSHLFGSNAMEPPFKPKLSGAVVPLQSILTVRLSFKGAPPV